MPVERQGRCSRTRKRFSPADFKVFPLSLPSHLGQLVNGGRRTAFTKHQWTAKISKRETNAPAARHNTAHLHHWNQRHQFAALRTAEINRFVAIGLGQDLGPSGAVKETALGMGKDKAIPIRIEKGVDEFYIHS